MVVLDAQNNFWSSVVPTLNIKETCGTVLTTGSKINDFDPVAFLICKKNIFGFHVTMDNFLVFHVFETLAYLS